MLHAIVPVKHLSRAKMRLAPVLASDERRVLVLAMLTDVLRALRVAPQIDYVTVISHDALVLAQATEHGALALRDAATSLNGALTQAAAHATHQGAAALLVLPADVPFVTPRDIDALIAALDRGPGAVLAPSPDGGTNGLLVRPPLALPFLFGTDSLAHHRSAAQAHNVPVKIVHLPGLERDIDQPDDLMLLANATPGSATAQVLHALEQRLTYV